MMRENAATIIPGCACARARPGPGRPGILAAPAAARARGGPDHGLRTHTDDRAGARAAVIPRNDTSSDVLLNAFEHYTPAAGDELSGGHLARTPDAGEGDDAGDGEAARADC